MPLKRYEIRNEYSLGDPELYQVANNKDDPEALLEGVSMAALVGVLRQLGDLAEFAAEVFHDLHEEVMATAARGHCLIVRVQQLESDFSPVERTLLSQTSHTSFLYNSGVDWQPNLHKVQNLITQRDLPRFVMDSYEDCRGPPQLFLLDKFDVAGSNACLKRYTDPSFFKVEATSSTGRNIDGQKERKTRRVKKKGSRWRIGDTPENFRSSHAKLHQLFLEERIETGGIAPDRRVKLKKRQFTGSPFGQDKEKNYMEKFLETCPLEQKIIHEIHINPLPLPWASKKQNFESGLEIAEIDNVSSFKESIEAERNTSSYPSAMDVVAKPSMEDFVKDESNKLIANEDDEVTRFDYGRNYGKLSPTIKVSRDDEYLDGEHMSESRVNDGLDSEDFTSEIECYVDALPIIDSEVETDSERKKNPKNMNLKSVAMDSDTSRRKMESQSLDAQSFGSSIMSVDGNNFVIEGESFSCSVSVDASTEASLDRNETVMAAPVSVSKLGNENMSVDLQSMSDEIRNKPDEHTAMDTVGESSSSSVKVNALADTTPEHDAAVVDLPSIPVSRMDFDNLPVDHCFMSEEIPGSKPEERTVSSVVLEADESFESVKDIKKASNSCVVDQETMTLLVDIKAKSSSNCLPNLDINEVNCNSTKPIDQGHADKCVSWSINGKIDDASTETDSGDWSHGERTVHEVVAGNSSVYSESSNQSDGLVDWIHVESKKSDSVISSVEECSDDGRADVDVCFDTRPPFFHQHISDYIFQETAKSTSLVSNVDMSTLSSEGVSTDQYAAVYSTQDFNIIEQFPEMKNPAQISLPDFEAAVLPSSHESSVEVFAGVQSKAEAQFVAVDQTEILPPVCNGQQSHAPCALSEITSGIETTAGGVSSSGNESNNELLSGSCEGEKNFSEMEKTDVVVSDHHSMAEKAKQYLRTEINTEGQTVYINGDESHPSVSGREPSLQDLKSACSDQSYKVTCLDELESLVIQADAASYGGLKDNCDDENEVGPYDAFLFDVPSKPAIETYSVYPTGGNLDLHHEIPRVEITKSVTDDKVQEQSFELTEDFNPNEGELSLRLAAELTPQNQVDSVQDAPENSNFDRSSSEHPTLTLLNSGSLVENVQNSENSSDEQVPVTFGHDVMASSFNQIHMLRGNEDHAESVSKNLPKPMNPFDEGSDLLDANEMDSLHDDDVYSVAKLPTQSAEHTLESSSQPMVNPSLVFHGNDICHDDYQAKQIVEKSRLPTYTHGFPVQSMLPVEHQINLDAPPLPPLPPMQWRLSKFQNSSTAPEKQTLQSSVGLVQPVLATLPGVLKPNNVNGITKQDNVIDFSTSRPVLQNAHAAPERQLLQQPIGSVQPMPDAVLEVSSHNKVNEIQRDDNQSFTATSMSAVSHNGAQVSPDIYVAPQEVLMQPMLSSTSELSSQNGDRVSDEFSQVSEHYRDPLSMIEGHFDGHNPSVEEVKADAKMGIQAERLEDIPHVREQDTVNSHVQIIPSPPKTQPPTDIADDRVSVNSDGCGNDETPANANGSANDFIQKKLTRPRNPLIDEVVAFELRKFKPPLESRSEERESLLEQLKLRKIERNKPSKDTNADEGESALELLQLKKVGDRIKGEIEQKPEETESPRMQLRKVDQRAHHLVGSKTEDRDTLLEQIRSKSFNLKPAVVARPNIQVSKSQGPRTNLKVAAIIEKASNIRQAMAGSDEEDEADNWSDC